MWDGKVWGLQVTNTSEHTLELRAPMNAPNSPAAFDLRCYVREKLIQGMKGRDRRDRTTCNQPLEAASKNVRIKSGDKLDSGDHLAQEGGIIRQEKISSGLRGTCEVNGIGGLDAESTPDSRIVFSSLQGKRQHLRNHAVQLAARLLRQLRKPSAIRPCQHFPKRQGASNELVPALLHSGAYAVNFFCEMRTIFKPINEEHCVPIDSAQSFSSIPSKAFRSARR